MAYYAPRQHGITGKWHFTLQEGNAIKAVGPCAEECPGHDSAHEAVVHYALWLFRRHAVISKGGLFGSCRVCGMLTNQYFTFATKGVRLCVEHMDDGSFLRFVDFGSLMHAEYSPTEPEGIVSHGI